MMPSALRLRQTEGHRSTNTRSIWFKVNLGHPSTALIRMKVLFDGISGDCLMRLGKLLLVGAASR